MLSPEEIRTRTFLVSLRGYDREEVQTFLEQVAGELALLHERLEAAEGAAQELPTAAEIVAEAGGDRPAATEGAAAPFAEIGQETQRILEAAQAAGEELQRRAREDADRELKAARAQAARVLADAERRRDEIEGSVRALEEAREGLAGDLRDVGRTIERLLRELAPTAEATTTVRAAFAEAARVASEAGHDHDDAPAEDADAEAAAGSSDPADTATPPAVDERDEHPELEAGAATEVEAATKGPSGGEPAEPAPAQRDDDVPGEASHPGAAANGGFEPAANGGGPEPAAGQAPPAGEAPVQSVRLVTLPPTGGEAGAQPAEVGEAPAPADAPARQRATWTLPERVPVQARGEALAPSHPKLVRRLKRGLQDVENATLDRLRRMGEDLDVEAALPGTDAADALAGLARGHVTNAYAVGYHSGASAVGQGAGDPPDLTHDLAGDLAAEVVGALAGALRSRFADPATGDPPALGDEVDAAFADVRDGFVREASAVALIRAYEWGQHDAWVTAGIDGRKWALATEPECGDPRCEDNAGSGVVALGEPFPSGHAVPPARAGCSCTTVPLVSRS